MTTMSMPSHIVCGRCPKVYLATEIRALHGEEETNLAALNASLAASPTSKRRWRRNGRDERNGGIFAPNNLDVLGQLKSWTFKCPRDHDVDANEGFPLPIAVLGESGASKSHFLPGIVYELFDLARLARLGVRLQTSATTDPQLQQNKVKLYQQGLILDRTPGGQIEGPYGYQLRIKSRADTTDTIEARYVLQVFDVAGENLASVVDIAANAQFLFVCRGLIVLIDPVGLLRTAFDEGVRTNAEMVKTRSDVRNSISVLAEALTRVWGRPARELGIPICFVFAKADSIDWSFPYTQETARVLQEVSEGAPLAEVLTEASGSVERELRGLGVDLVIDEIVDAFGRAHVRFAAASATSSMPLPGSSANGQRAWTDPEPTGIALAMLQVLQMLHAVQG